MSNKIPSSNFKLFQIGHWDFDIYLPFVRRGGLKLGFKNTLEIAAPT